MTLTGDRPQDAATQPASAIDREIVFPRGLFGFPQCQRWVLAEAGRDGLYWMQSLDHEALAFLIADPFQFAPDFVVDVPSPVLAELEATSPVEVAVLAIVTLPGGFEEHASMNLQGPLVFNLVRRRGQQIVVQDSPFSTHHPLVIAVD